MNYTAKDRGRAIALLRASAAKARDGEPNYSRISAETAISRSTLERWWAREVASRGEAPATEPAAAPAPGAAPTPSAEHLAEAIEQLGIPDAAHRDVRHVARLMAERDSFTAPTARQAQIKLVHHAIRELRVAAPTTTGPTTPEEWVEQILSTPDLLVEALCRRIDLLDDPRIEAARAAARGR